MKLPILYKRSNLLEKISTWEIEIEDNKFRTTSGFTDGLKFTGNWTECISKNLGKKNGTTPQAQALVQATALWTKKKELGSFERINEIDDPILFRPMLASKWEDEKHRVKYPLASQRKYDGIRCIIHSGGMFTRNGKQIISAPHIFDSLKDIFEKYPFLVLDGELYADKDEADFNKIISCVRKTKPEEEDLIESAKYVKYWVYDLPSSENVFEQRYIELTELFEELPSTCVRSEIELVYSEHDILPLHDKYVSEGFEGQILRDLKGTYQNKRSKFLLKYKSFDDAEFTILGVIEGIGKLHNKVGKLVFDGFDCAVNGTHEFLSELWNRREELIGLTATVKYFGLTTTDNPVPRFPKVIAIRDYE